MKNLPIQRATFETLHGELALDNQPETITIHQPIPMEKKIVILPSLEPHYPNSCQILGNQISFRKLPTCRKVYEIAKAISYITCT